VSAGAPYFELKRPSTDKAVGNASVTVIRGFESRRVHQYDNEEDQND